MDLILLLLFKRQLVDPGADSVLDEEPLALALEVRDLGQKGLLEVHDILAFLVDLFGVEVLNVAVN